MIIYCHVIKLHGQSYGLVKKIWKREPKFHNYENQNCDFFKIRGTKLHLSFLNNIKIFWLDDHGSFDFVNACSDYSELFFLPLL